MAKDMKKDFKKMKCIVLLLLLAVAAIWLPGALRNDYNRRIVNISMVYMIVAMGLNFIIGLVGQMNLGSAGMYAAGAYTAALLATKLGLSLWCGVLAAIVVALIIGVGLGYPCLKLSGIYLALTTMAFGEIIRLILNNTSFAGGAIGIMEIPSFSIGSFVFDTQTKMFYLVLTFTFIMTLIALRIVHSKWGRVMRAIKYSPDVVSSAGVNIASMKVKAFTLSAIYIGIAGVLNVGMAGYTYPGDYSADISVRFFMMLLVGGVGSVPGCMLGALVVTILPEFLRFTEDYYHLIFYAIVFIMARVIPHGLISLPSEFFKLYRNMKQRSHNRCQCSK